jgi:hypothetical protein
MVRFSGVDTCGDEQLQWYVGSSLLEEFFIVGEEITE